jgi:protoporphyrinogen oxidase/SAM-dependent methyltransferase
VKRVGIIGGGPSGLFTAFLLESNAASPLAVTLFEASDRLGGKVHTRSFSKAPALYESGAAELYRYGNDPLYVLVTTQLGLTPIEMSANTVVLGNDIIRNHHEFRSRFGKKAALALKDFHKLTTRMRPYKDFYDSGWPRDNRHPWLHRSFNSLLRNIRPHIARHYINTLIHSDLATEPHATNALYGVENYLLNDPRYCRFYSLSGGLEKLVTSLVDRLQATMLTSHRALEVGKTSDNGYFVACNTPSGLQRFEFDAIAIAMPVYSLPSVKSKGKRLADAMNAHYLRYDSPGHYLRVSALFQNRFWTDLLTDSLFHHDAFGGCCVYDETARHPSEHFGVLGWLMGGSAAMALSNHNDSDLISLILDSLPGNLATTARQQFIEGRVHRWLGAVSGESSGRKIRGSKARHKPEPTNHPGLFVVGDYLFDSTINGAFDSADIVARLVLKELDVNATILPDDYFDYYSGDDKYEDSFSDHFDAAYVGDLVRYVWRLEPPYSLLDAGSANGLTLDSFAASGIDATGLENSPYIHSRTPSHLLDRNILGDICDMPFADNAFDFIYETCLVYVSEHNIPRALKELRRVARRGVIFGSVFSDMRAKIVREERLLSNAQTRWTSKQWMNAFIAAGFAPAITSEEILRQVWKYEKRANRGRLYYRSAKQLGACFFTKLETATDANDKKEALPNGTQSFAVRTGQ